MEHDLAVNDIESRSRPQFASKMTELLSDLAEVLKRHVMLDAQNAERTQCHDVSKRIEPAEREPLVILRT